MFLLNVLIVYILLVPLAVFIHEMGHALGIILFTKHTHANLFLGPPNNEKCKRFAMGRINFHFRWATFGFCFSADKEGKRTTEKLSEAQGAIIAAGGPFLSLVFALIAFSTSPLFTGELYALMRAFTILNLATFLSTALPYKYPSWKAKPLAGMPTDGYRVRALVRKIKQKRKEQRNVG
ncbi:site-2 protease family protein [Bacillus salacetis]|uniref:site-2 protease family protein n=1 Tax=Bacillus salacetis TaxID=2315464 RepID=UPI003B9EDDED